MPTDYFVNGSQQISQAIVFDDARAKAIANMSDGSIRFVSNPGRPSVTEDLVWAANGTITLRTGILLEHFDCHAYAFRKLLHRRHHVLLSLCNSV